MSALLDVYVEERAELCRTNLQRANRNRLQRAALRRRFRELGRLGARELAAELVLDPPEWLEGMLVYEFLTRIPYTTPDRARLALERRGINVGSRTIGGLRGLTDRQAVQIAASLRAPGGIR